MLLHGWGMNLRVFDGLRAELAQRFRVLAVDLPGHGRSPWSPGLTQAGQLEALTALLPPGARLLGWSLGGQLALQLATRARIERLVLLASTPCFVVRADWPHALAPEVLAQFAHQLQCNYRQALADFLELQVRGSAHAASALATLRAAILTHGEAAPEALSAGLEMLMRNDLRSQLGELGAPVLLLYGERDRITPPAAALATAALLPRSMALGVRRAAHAPFLSHPAEVLAALQEFLA
jgi:pimeloyl-[acyl-carrier protein] methyl ester esterase